VADEVVLKLSAHLAARPAVAVTLPFLRADGKLDVDLTRHLLFSNKGRPWFQQSLDRPWNLARKAAGVPEAAQINGLARPAALCRLGVAVQRAEPRQGGGLPR
jgi:hypothetical protein